MPTVGQINEEISRLRSKIAVTKGIVLHLKTNYMPADGGNAEMFFVRTDFGRVPAEHVELTVADLVAYLDGLQIELLKWEATPVGEPPKEAVMPTEPEVAKPTVEVKVAPKTNGHPAKPKETPIGTANRSQDQPATGPAPAGKSG